MHMQVLHFLSAFGASVADNTEAALRVWPAALLQGESGRQRHHVPHQASVFRPQLREGRDVLLGNQQKMHWRPRVNVMERKHMVVFMNLSGGYLTQNDLAEQAVGVVCHARSLGYRPTGWLLFIATMPFTMRYRNQIDTRAQAIAPGK